MREVKFRAWDKDEKKFWYFNLQEILERQMAYTGSFDRKILVGEKTQYTGLKDKNRTEIYEGDIVKHMQYVEYGKLSEHTGEVTISPISGVMVGMDCIGREIEVIGNIYENPELLK